MFPPPKKNMRKIYGFAMSVPFYFGGGGLNTKILPLGVGDDVFIHPNVYG